LNNGGSVLIEHVVVQEEGSEDELEGADALELEPPVFEFPLLVSPLLVPRFAFIVGVVTLVEASGGGRSCPEGTLQDIPPRVGIP
jgi:hypothetical protein